MERFLSILRVRREEVPTALLMTLYFFLAMASVSIVKSLQNALYLGRVGFDWRLPFLYLILALVSGVGVLFLRRLARRYSRIQLNLLTVFSLLCSLGLFFVLLNRRDAWVSSAFYVWGGIFTLLLPTQGWMLSYQLYTTREAKRLFSVLGMGGILGGACGGYYAALLARSMGTQWLLFQVGLLLGLMHVVLLAIRRQMSLRPDPLEDRKFTGEIAADSFLRRLFSSRHLSFLAAVILLSTCASTLIDLQFKWALGQKYGPLESQITQFFGTLLGTIFILSALVQMFATGRLLRGLGVGVTLLILPVSLAVVSLPALIAAKFWDVVALKVIDGGFRSSLQKTSVELLYIPISSQATMSAKGMIDVVVFRLGDALAAAIFLATYAWSRTPPEMLLLVILMTSLLWAGVAWRLGREYVRTLRRSLEIKSTPSSRRAFQLMEAAAERTLLTALKSPRPAKVHFALTQLMKLPRESGRSKPDLTSSGGELAPSQLSEVYSTGAPGWLSAVEPLLDHTDIEVAAAALHLLLRHRPGRHLKQFRSDCGSSSIPNPLCLYYLDHYVQDLHTVLYPRRVMQWCQKAEPVQARSLARLMGRTCQTAYLPILREWVSSSDRELARAAIRSIGSYRRPECLEMLQQYLACNWSRQAAAKALAQYGDSLVGHLMALLKTLEVESAVKREIPHILTLVDSAASREGLVSALYLPDPEVSFRALKGLNKIRRHRDLSWGEMSFAPLLQIWARQYYELLNLDLLLDQEDGGAGRLLKRALLERMDWGIEKIFRGLELFLPPGDAYFSYLGFTSDERRRRENAIELIDARVRGELRQTLLPIFAAHDRSEAATAGRALFHLPTHLDAVLSNALFLADPWLKCCIIAAVRALDRKRLRRRLEQICQDIDPLVRETAEWALADWTES
ncbi:MAG: Npt1/Npt2 family nucleotide transporter [Acidobacteriota bacterium]